MSKMEERAQKLYSEYQARSSAATGWSPLLLFQAALTEVVEDAAKVRVPKPDKLNIHNWEWIWDLAQDEMSEAIKQENK